MLLILNPAHYIQRLGRLFTASQLRSLIAFYSKKSRGAEKTSKRSKRVRSNYGHNLGRPWLGRKKCGVVHRTRIIQTYRRRPLSSSLQKLKHRKRFPSKIRTTPSDPDGVLFLYLLDRVHRAERHIQESSKEVNPESRIFLEQLSRLEVSHNAEVALWPAYHKVRTQLQQNERNIAVRMDEMRTHAEKANSLDADNRWEQEEYERKLQFGRAQHEQALGYLMQGEPLSGSCLLRRFNLYEAKWDVLTGNSVVDDPVVLTFSNMPFPLLEDISSPFDLDTDRSVVCRYSGANLAICHFIFHRKRPGFEEMTAKDRLELELERWDWKFLASHVLPLVVESERGAVEEAIGRVARVLLELKGELDSESTV